MAEFGNIKGVMICGRPDPVEFEGRYVVFISRISV
jgi:hypothetical protein